MIRTIAFLALMLPMPLFAQERTSPSTMTMGGSARVIMEPDVVLLHGTISVANESAEKALANVEARIASLIETMKPFGETRASRIAVGQNRAKGKRLLGSDDPGFFARGSVTVKLNDPSTGAKALDAIGKRGIEGVATLEYDVAERGPLIAQARQQAVADAVERAETYAAAAGVTLGALLDIEETGGNTATSQRQAVSYGSSSSGGYSGKKWSAGSSDIAVSAHVTIRWAIN